LQDTSISIDKNLFWGLAKNRATTLHKVTCVKKCPKWWFFFGFILEGKLAT